MPSHISVLIKAQASCDKLKEEKEQLVSDTIVLNEIIENLESKLSGAVSKFRVEHLDALNKIDSLSDEVLYHAKARREQSVLLDLQEKLKVKSKEHKGLQNELQSESDKVIDKLKSENADLKRKYEKLSEECDLTKLANEIGDFDSPIQPMQELGNLTYRVVPNKGRNEESFGFADRDIAIWKKRNRDFDPDAWYKITTNQMGTKLKCKVELLSVDYSKQYPNGLYHVVNPKNVDVLLDTILLSVNFRGIQISHLVDAD
jgi:hypothetical protein